MIPEKRAGFGTGCRLALTSAGLFGAITPLARIAYENGTDPVSLVAVRFWCAAALLAVFFQLSGRHWRVARPGWAPIAVTGAGWFVATVGYLSSVQYIPVGLAVLVFYTAPLMVAALTPFTERTRLSGTAVAGVLCAFAGLALALGQAPGLIDWRGVALALAGAAGAAVTFLAGAHATRHAEPLRISLYMNLGCALAGTVMVLVSGDLAMPHNPVGAGALAAATGLFIVAVIAQFGALAHIAPAIAAILFNIEPFVTITLAALLLHERLALLQWVGAALVIAGIILVTRPGATRTVPMPAG